MNATQAAPLRDSSPQRRFDRRQPCSPQRNHLLAALPSEIQEQLSPLLQAVELNLGNNVYEIDDPMDHLYFPVTATLSVICALGDGDSAQVAAVGHEGMIGIASLMGCSTAQQRMVVINPGTAYRVSASYFKDAFEHHPKTIALMLRYTQARMTQVAINVACLRHHAIPQQLCRLLLTCLDRQWGNRLTLTHETIGQMLGVWRGSVSEAAMNLQLQGAISYRRGNITVLDRSKLECMSCECYDVLQRSCPLTWCSSLI